MTTKLEAAARQALGALEQAGYGGSYAAIDLREALAEQEKQEPVAWWELNEDIGAWFLAYTFNPKAKTRPLIFGDVFQSQDSTIEKRSWPEDFSHENGEYCKTCVHCQRQFIGHKRRVSCKVCSNAAPVSAKRECVDLTCQEITALIMEGAAGGGWQGFAERVLAAWKEKNK